MFAVVHFVGPRLFLTQIGHYHHNANGRFGLNVTCSLVVLANLVTFVANRT